MTHYQALGVQKTATAEEIGKAFREKARRYHPDRCKDSGAEEKFKRINEAYQALNDPEKRKEYDASLKPTKKKSLAQFIIEDPKVQEGLRVATHSILDILMGGARKP